jgi:hypothetical protein
MTMFLSCDTIGLGLVEYEARLTYHFDKKWAGPSLYSNPPVRFFDTNPAVPAFTGDRYELYVAFVTEPGQYYMEYVMDNNRAFYMIYTINIYHNSVTVTSSMEGFEDDHYVDFSILLMDDGPSFTDGNEINTDPIIGEIPSRSITQRSALASGRQHGPIIGRREKVTKGSSMLIEYGSLYED